MHWVECQVINGIDTDRLRLAYIDPVCATMHRNKVVWFCRCLQLVHMIWGRFFNIHPPHPPTHPRSPSKKCYDRGGLYTSLCTSFCIPYLSPHLPHPQKGNKIELVILFFFQARQRRGSLALSLLKSQCCPPVCISCRTCTMAWKTRSVEHVQGIGWITWVGCECLNCPDQARPFSLCDLMACSYF